MLKRWTFLIVLLLVLPINVYAQDIPDRPTTAGYVFDYQEVIDDEVEAEINEIAKLLQSEGIMELMIVTVPTIGELEPYEYGMKFFREWGIGDGEKDNGLLIYATTDMGEKKNVIRISTGDGLEGDYPDSETNHLIQTYMKASLKAGDYTMAFANVVDAIRVKEGVDYTWGGDVVPTMPADETTEEFVEEEGGLGSTIWSIISFIFFGGLALVGLGIGLAVLWFIYIIIEIIFRELQGWYFNRYEAKHNKDIRTKGYIRYREKEEKERLEREAREEEERLKREAEEEERRLKREEEEAKYLALLVGGSITQEEYDKLMAKPNSSSSSDSSYYDDSYYDSSSSSSDSYSYGSGDSSGGGSDDRF